ncbi:MAG: hypothetical protein KG012_09985 [Deltaproteobacteria bacterium]|jgi:hypothetical protein|nr:hypothetical protein [Deltaproteobacteria bacterium]MBS3919209.1 hypothetical protein [Deltaproteobacteria bacterium]
MAKEIKGGKYTSDLVLDLYSSLLLEVWEVVSAMVGEAILELLFNLSIKKISEKYPFLKSLEVSEEGIDSGKVKEECRSLPPVEIHRGFQSLINHLLNLFSALTEGVISREVFPKVFPKVREAERLISQK